MPHSTSTLPRLVCDVLATDRLVKPKPRKNVRKKNFVNSTRQSTVTDVLHIIPKEEEVDNQDSVSYSINPYIKLENMSTKSRGEMAATCS